MNNNCWLYNFHLLSTKFPSLGFICYFQFVFCVVFSLWGRVQFQKINFVGLCDDSQCNSNIMKTHKIGNKSFKSSSRYNENRGVVIVWSGNSCGDELIKTAKKGPIWSFNWYKRFTFYGALFIVSETLFPWKASSPTYVSQLFYFRKLFILHKLMVNNFFSHSCIFVGKYAPASTLFLQYFAFENFNFHLLKQL